MIVAKLDRFARTLVGALGTLEELERHGTVLVSVAENIDLSTPMVQEDSDGMRAAAEELADAEAELEAFANDLLRDRRWRVRHRPRRVVDMVRYEYDSCLGRRSGVSA